jgi:predicted enzyme related to lactoylglutathione lyase
MGLDLFVGIPVTDYAAALPWYEQFFGGRPSFLPNDTEAVWEVAEHRYIYIVQDPQRAGNALVLSFVDDRDDLDDRVANIARRGIAPAKRETPGSGVTKVIYKDTDGNEISFGGALTGASPKSSPPAAGYTRPHD